MPSTDPRRRAVITGLGAVTPIGNDHPTFWANAKAGVSGGGPITHFDASDLDVRIAAEVKDFDEDRVGDRKELRKMDLFTKFAIAAITPSPPPPPYSSGQVIPSQPFAASFFMKARRSGVSASCVKFSRWGSITTGSWFSTSHCSTLLLSSTLNISQQIHNTCLLIHWGSLLILSTSVAVENIVTKHMSRWRTRAMSTLRAAVIAEAISTETLHQVTTVLFLNECSTMRTGLCLLL